MKDKKRKRDASQNHGSDGDDEDGAGEEEEEVVVDGDRGADGLGGGAEEGGSGRLIAGRALHQKRIIPVFSRVRGHDSPFIPPCPHIRRGSSPSSRG